jgi:hypothetical protein
MRTRVVGATTVAIGALALVPAASAGVARDARHFQLNLDLNTGYFIILQWSLSTTSQLLRVDSNGVQRALYSHMPGAPACGAPAAPS